MKLIRYSFKTLGLIGVLPAAAEADAKPSEHMDEAGIDVNIIYRRIANCKMYTSASQRRNRGHKVAFSLNST